MGTDLEGFAELIPLDYGLCVVSTLRGDGGVQSSVVNAGVLEHPLRGGRVVGLVATGGSRKLHHLRADPRATIVARAGWRWTAVEGDAEIIGRVMAEERRAAVLVTPRRVYGNPPAS